MLEMQKFILEQIGQTGLSSFHNLKLACILNANGYPLGKLRTAIGDLIKQGLVCKEETVVYTPMMVQVANQKTSVQYRLTQEGRDVLALAG